MQHPEKEVTKITAKKDVKVLIKLEIERVEREQGKLLKVLRS
jgi:hypothetical protein